jgi:single-stranded DNA-binding protein
VIDLELHGFCRVANDPRLVDVGNTVKVTFSGVIEEKRTIKSTNETVKTPHFFEFECWDSGARFIFENVERGDLLYVKASPREELIDFDNYTKKRVFFRINTFRAFEN